MVLKINNSTAKIYIQTEVCKKIIKKFAHANAFFFNGIIYCIDNKNPLLYILHEIDTVYDTTSTMQSSLITTKKMPSQAVYSPVDCNVFLYYCDVWAVKGLSRLRFSL